MKRLVLVVALAGAWAMFRVHAIEADRARPHHDDGVLRVVVIGDSLAHGAGDATGRGIGGWLDRLLQVRGVSFVPTANLGVNGSRTRDVLRLLSKPDARALVARADTVIVSLGGNDLYGDSIARMTTSAWPDHAIDTVLTRLSVVVGKIHAINPDAHIALLGLFDPYLETRLRLFLDHQVNLWDAQLIARFASDTRVDVVRIADLVQSADRLSRDGFHPSAETYSLIAARIAPTL